MKTTLLLLFCLATTCLNAQIVNIPDSDFKYILVNYESFFDYTIDTNFDDEIQYSEAAAMTGTLIVGDPWVFNGNIQDLTGIEAFANITGLICMPNQLTTLDLSQNTALKVLNCAHNQLVSLNISQCNALEELKCSHNQLTALDVSQNILLEYLDCGDNQLTALDVTQNTNLNILYCNSNQLATLNLTQNINLEEFSGFNNSFNMFDVRNGNNTVITLFTTFDNPDLSCIFVDNANYSETNPNWARDPNSTYVETQEACDNLAGIFETKTPKITLYPNPAENILYIDNRTAYSIDHIEVTDITGKKVFSSNGKNKINLSYFSKGIYFIELYDHSTKILTKKIIKL